MRDGSGVIWSQLRLNELDKFSELRRVCGSLDVILGFLKTLNLFISSDGQEDVERLYVVFFIISLCHVFNDVLSLIITQEKSLENQRSNEHHTRTPTTQVRKTQSISCSLQRSKGVGKDDIDAR